MKRADITKLRLQLLANGYAPLPNLDKVCKLKSWPKVVITPEVIQSWQKTAEPATGLRVEKTLAVTDFDVGTDYNGLKAQWLAEAQRLAPDYMAGALLRLSAGDKAAWFGATDKPFGGKLKSHKWMPPGCDPKDDDTPTFRLEVFSAGDTRQFGAFGPHKRDANRRVISEYSWPGKSPADTPLADLPKITAAQANELCNAFDRIAATVGLVLAIKDKPPGSPDVFYILEADTVLDTEEHGQITVEEAAKMAPRPGEEYFRCSGSFHDKGRRNPTSHTISTHKEFGVQIYDFADGVFYRLASAKPADPPDLSALKALHLLHGGSGGSGGAGGGGGGGSAPGGEPPAPDDAASLFEKSKWLLETRGYCEFDDVVIRLWEPSDRCRTKRMAFKARYAAWSEQVTATRRAYATDLWEFTPKRMHIDHVQMRPDRPFPWFTESSKLVKNTYLQPVHQGDGDIAVWLAFVEHLLPDPIERDWFLNWLAHKHRNPGIPGVAVVMMACSPTGPVYGTGRGMLKDVLTRLWGAAYVRPIGFDIITGKSGQADFTDWAAYATLVVVDESKDTPDAGKFSDRRATYERLKEIVDPRPVTRHFTVKNQQAFYAPCFASYLICSNNRDALQIPEKDRRFAVLSNGAQLPEARADELQVWMDQPGNIATLARWLEAYALAAGFSAYRPLDTAAKRNMQTLARTDMDDWMDTIRERVGRQNLFTSEIIVSALSVLAGSEAHSDRFKAMARRRVKIDSMAPVFNLRVRRASGRQRVLVWHDYDGPDVATMKTEEIMAAVDASHRDAAGQGGFPHLRPVT